MCYHTNNDNFEYLPLGIYFLKILNGKQGGGGSEKFLPNTNLYFGIRIFIYTIVLCIYLIVNF